MKYIYQSIILLLFFSLESGYGQAISFTDEAIKADLIYLKDQLLNKHPNIYIYHSKEAFQSFFTNIHVPEVVSANEAYRIIASTSSIIKDGHTLFYPDFNLTNQNNERGHFIPLKIFWDGTNLFVKENYSDNAIIGAGMKILSINGIKSENLIDAMLQMMMRDGDNFNYPIWVLNNYFYEYYSYFYGCPTVFNLEIEGVDKNNKEVNIAGLLKSDLLNRINKHTENDEKAIYATFDLDHSIATLTIKDWHTSVLRKRYKQQFKKEINTIFKEIETLGIKNLIIDVRNNQGGNTKYSKYLLSYLLEHPFKLVEEYRKVKNTNVIKTRGPQMGYHKPNKQLFSGKLFVLINGGSFSNTGVFCSVLQQFDRATFIGEETGGSGFVICGHTKMIKLPNTGIQVEIPMLQFLIKDYTYTKLGLSGVQPSYEIKPTINSLIEGKDLEKDFAIELIKNQADRY